MTTTPSEVHTPLPWNLHRLDARIICAGNDKDGDPIVVGMSKDGSRAMYHFGDVYATVSPKAAKANAALIVTAVNERPKLLKALQETTDMLEAVCKQLQSWGHDPVVSAYGRIESNRAALKAE
jgi:hypothetical protein